MDIYIETLGCPKNMCDSENAAGALESAGHRIVDAVGTADAVIVNTCGFIGDAKEESISCIFDMYREKADDALLIVSGCLSEMYGDKLFRQMHEADIVIGVNDYACLPGILENYDGKRYKRFSFCCGEYEEIPRKRIGAPYSAYLKIAEGCGNNCAYCVIPKIRGAYRSRKKENILREAYELAKQGCRELILVAQDVTAYGIDLYGEYVLPGILKQLCRIPEIRWIRLMYCYEDRITLELINTIRGEDKICKYIDMPVQHCSDKILGAMNRRSTRSSIEGTVRRLRADIPDIHIRTTVIAGLPGEDAKDFSELLGFIKEMKFERLGVFAYSKEEGTLAAGMKPQVRAKTKESRKNSIMLAQLEISLAHNTGKIGKIIEVMVEGREDDGIYYGRSRFDAPDIDNAVFFSSERECKPGDIVNIEITDAFDYDLFGREAT